MKLRESWDELPRFWKGVILFLTIFPIGPTIGFILLLIGVTT